MTAGTALEPAVAAVYALLLTPVLPAGASAVTEAGIAPTILNSTVADLEISRHDNSMHVALIKDHNVCDVTLGPSLQHVEQSMYMLAADSPAVSRINRFNSPAAGTGDGTPARPTASTPAGLGTPMAHHDHSMHMDMQPTPKQGMAITAHEMQEAIREARSVLTDLSTSMQAQEVAASLSAASTPVRTKYVGHTGSFAQLPLSPASVSKAGKAATDIQRPQSSVPVATVKPNIKRTAPEKVAIRKEGAIQTPSPRSGDSSRSEAADDINVTSGLRKTVVSDSKLNKSSASECFRINLPSPSRWSDDPSRSVFVASPPSPLFFSHPHPRHLAAPLLFIGKPAVKSAIRAEHGLARTGRNTRKDLGKDTAKTPNRAVKAARAEVNDLCGLVA